MPPLRPPFLKKSGAWVSEHIRFLVKYSIIFLCFYHFVLQISVVRGHSMDPLLSEGDRLVVDKFTPRMEPLRPGDVVVFRYPDDPDKDYVKRLIGLPGQEIELRNGQLLVNRQPVAEPYVVKSRRENFGPLRVRAGHYFVLGDNRANSSDSRAWGGVPRDYVKGRVLFRFWPLKSFALFPSRASAWLLLVVVAALLWYMVLDTAESRPEYMR